MRVDISMPNTFLLHVIMRWLLAGYFGLALINISVAQNHDLVITQKPRFYGLKPGPNVYIHCLPSKRCLPPSVQWFKAATFDEDTKTKIVNSERINTFTDMNATDSCYLYIRELHITDSGVYFCKINDVWGPGTEVQVAKPINPSKALYRSKMKDGLIIIQGLLLAVCIAAILLRKRKIFEKRDSIYEEPETDHIYEGLAIETCGGGLYEELSVYAEADGAEAPWE